MADKALLDPESGCSDDKGDEKSTVCQTVVCVLVLSIIVSILLSCAISFVTGAILAYNRGDMSPIVETAIWCIAYFPKAAFHLGGGQ